MKQKNMFSVLFCLVLFVMPTSTNYKIHDYGIGGGGSSGSSANFGLTAKIGELGGALSDGTNYSLGSGVLFTQLANIPGAPTLTNPSSYYNKLRLVIDAGGNPSDAKFAVAISTDNFLTTQYVKSDFTVGTTLDLADYQTYSGWGGATGVLITGLEQDTTYQVKARAMHGEFTESGYSATAQASTSQVSLTIDLDISAVDTESSPPYVLNFGALAPGVVTTAGQKIWVDLDTNAVDGAEVYVQAGSDGLSSVSAAHTITSVTGDLGSVIEGYGLQAHSAGQLAGGPLVALPPYNLALNSVGELNTLSLKTVLQSTAPVTGGRATFFLKAKSATTTPAAADYSQLLTVTAAARF